MSAEEYREKMKTIQRALLEYLEEECNLEENFEIFIKDITNKKIKDDKHELKLLLSLINIISNNHQRVHNFFSKIEKILEYLKKEILNFFSNSEIFVIFRDNKRILLFLIEKQIIIIDEYIVFRMTRYESVKKSYHKYFAPEIKRFLTKEFIQKYQNKNGSLKKGKFIDKIKKEVPDDFYIKRKEGENDNFLCELIRTNQVKEFGAYVNRNNISLESCIEKSIFETNLSLIFHKKIQLIEYAAFFGSIDIIRYMRINGGVELTPNMWIQAIHSRNAELIKYLEDNRVSLPYNNYKVILSEAIKCHHNDVSNYIIEYLIKEKYLNIEIDKNYYDDLYGYAIEYYNYCFFPEDMKYKNIFSYLCKYGYYSLVKLYLEEGNIDINAKNIKINHLNDILNQIHS